MPAHTEPRTITIVFEQTSSGSWGSYVIGLEGCALATGATYDECLRMALEGLLVHIDAAREAGVAP